MKVLIKLGGTLLDDPAKCAQIAKQLALAAKKVQLVVVHGGGKQVTRFLEERGVKSRFVNGLRVSDEQVIDAVSKVIAGSVNKQLVAAVCAAGQPAVGISGVDGSLTTAAPVSSELQFVGKPQATDGKLLNILLAAGYLPLVACIAGGNAGQIYNVNADQMAVSCALGWKADRLFFLTDVAGVKDENNNLLNRLSIEGINGLVSSGVASGGMQAKLESAVWALEGGLAEVLIASGQEPGVCERLLAGESIGTRVALDNSFSRQLA